MTKFINAIIAGILIGIGGTVYLSCDNKYVGAFLFTVGLYASCVFGLELYTGRVGYIPTREPRYIADVVLALVGNLIGCLAVSMVVRTESLFAAVQPVSEAKLALPYHNLLFKAVMCGILMYVAVHSYRTQEGFPRLMGIFLGIPTFILSGFEHSIADAFYFFLAKSFTAHMAAALGMTVLGNAIGGMLIPAAQKFAGFIDSRFRSQPKN